MVAPTKISDFTQALYGSTFMGFIALWSKQTGKSHFFAADELPNLERSIIETSANEDIYLALGTQKEPLPPTKRGSADTVACLPGFVADVDFASAKDSKKNYPVDVNEARAILDTFPLKPSMIVHTGNGLHVHYLLNELHLLPTPDAREQAKRIWTAFQRRLITHFQSNGREIDSVGDLTRNYRIPGSFNHKSGSPRPVELVEFHLDRRYALSEIERLVEDVIDTAYDRKTFSEEEDYPPADHQAILEGCAWYRNVAVEGAAGCDEPNWYAAASITARCENGEQIFHSFSQAHPNYTKREADQKLKRAVAEAGPRTCKGIEYDLGHTDCAKCPHHRRITSPIQLGHDRMTGYHSGDDGPVPLGFTKDGSFAFLDRQRQIVLLCSSNQLLSAQYLVGLAPTAFWADQFAARKGPFDFMRAGEALIAACRRRGPFNPANVRGRGIWREDDRVVVNLGQPIESKRHLYLCFEPIELVEGAEFDGARLLKLLRMFNWRDPQDALLLFGWLALAPICGVLRWRPHCFVYGPARSGKTTIHSIALALLSPLVVAADGQATEAGIRQSLGPDSLPVILDEFESDQGAKGLQRIIRLARSASSAETPVLRGTPDGKPMSFIIRTAFFFAAINPRGMAPADQSRITMLELLMHDNDSAKARTIAAEEGFLRSLGSAWCSYMVSKAPLIEGALDVFEPLIPAADRRLRQNMSTMLGAAFVALHGRIPEVDEARVMMEGLKPTIDRHGQEVERDDALECLEHLFAHVVDNYPMGHWLAAELKRLDRHVNTTLDGARIVGMFDMIVRVDGDPPGFLIRHGSPAVERIFQGTTWAGGAWQRALHKLAGSFSPKDPVQFSGSGKKARCVGIPLSYLPEMLPEVETKF